MFDLAVTPLYGNYCNPKHLYVGSECFKLLDLVFVWSGGFWAPKHPPPLSWIHGHCYVVHQITFFVQCGHVQVYGCMTIKGKTPIRLASIFSTQFSSKFLPSQQDQSSPVCRRDGAWETESLYWTIERICSVSERREARIETRLWCQTSEDISGCRGIRVWMLRSAGNRTFLWHKAQKVLPFGSQFIFNHHLFVPFHCFRTSFYPLPPRVVGLIVQFSASPEEDHFVRAWPTLKVCFAACGIVLSLWQIFALHHPFPKKLNQLCTTQSTGASLCSSDYPRATQRCYFFQTKCICFAETAAKYSSRQEGHSWVLNLLDMRLYKLGNLLSPKGEARINSPGFTVMIEALFCFHW